MVQTNCPISFQCSLVESVNQIQKLELFQVILFLLLSQLLEDRLSLTEMCLAVRSTEMRSPATSYPKKYQPTTLHWGPAVDSLPIYFGQTKHRTFQYARP